MNEESYPFHLVEVRTIYKFESQSDTKTIQKLIKFSLLDLSSQTYNIALGDVLPDGTISDRAVSNNSDMPKVLSTVFKAIHTFLLQNTHAKVFIEGSTPSRTRLYQMVIARFLSDFELNFRILGYIGKNVEYFEKGKNYESFLISLIHHEQIERKLQDI